LGSLLEGMFCVACLSIDMLTGAALILQLNDVVPADDWARTRRCNADALQMGRVECLCEAYQHGQVTADAASREGVIPPPHFHDDEHDTE